MLKRLFALFLMLAWASVADPRINRTITVAAGTPVQLSTTPLYATEVFIQMAIGGTSPGYVMAGIPVGRTPAKSNSVDLTAQLCAATSTAPRCNYHDDITRNQGRGIDLSMIWVDGDHSGDTIIVSFNQEN